MRKSNNSIYLFIKYQNCAMRNLKKIFFCSLYSCGRYSQIVWYILEILFHQFILGHYSFLFWVEFLFCFVSEKKYIEYSGTSVNDDDRVLKNRR